MIIEELHQLLRKKIRKQEFDRKFIYLSIKGRKLKIA